MGRWLHLVPSQILEQGLCPPLSPHLQSSNLALWGLCFSHDIEGYRLGWSALAQTPRGWGVAPGRCPTSKILAAVDRRSSVDPSGDGLHCVSVQGSAEGGQAGHWLRGPRSWMLGMQGSHRRQRLQSPMVPKPDSGSEPHVRPARISKAGVLIIPKEDHFLPTSDRVENDKAVHLPSTHPRASPHLSWPLQPRRACVHLAVWTQGGRVSLWSIFHPAPPLPTFPTALPSLGRVGWGTDRAGGPFKEEIRCVA